jgi:ribosomal protein S18 acetylase RimI-like enzyme
MTHDPASLRFRCAVDHDLPRLVQLLADDTLGARRERFELPLPASYREAFAAIERDPNQELVVAENDSGAIVGMLQLSLVPSLTYQGGWRAMIEGVRVAAEFRSAGFGSRLIGWAIERARQRGCHMLQLTSDKSRPDAIRLYESLGFVASHLGMKLRLGSRPGASEQRQSVPYGQ